MHDANLCDTELRQRWFEIEKVSSDGEASLFLKFSLRRREGSFVLVVLALRNRPGTFVLLREVWPAGVNQEHIQLDLRPAILKETCTAFWHGDQFRSMGNNYSLGSTGSLSSANTPKTHS